MFDSSLYDPAEVGGLDDATLIAAVQDGARVAAAAEARKLAAIAELVRRRCVDEHPDWACDDWDAAAAELSCALTIGHGRASGLMDHALALRDRFPHVGELFLAGDISARTATTVVDRSALVTDDAALAALDTAIAEAARSWGALSQYKLEIAVDSCVNAHDPAAVRRTRNTMRSRDVTIGDPHDQSGTTTVFARLSTTDAALLDTCLTTMAKSVCPDDPRTLGQRRADALGALGAHRFHLACRCEDPDCPAKTDDGRATSFLIHIIAERHALTEPLDPHLHGPGLAPTPTEPANAPAPPTTAGATAPATPSPMPDSDPTQPAMPPTAPPESTDPAPAGSPTQAAPPPPTTSPPAPPIPKHRTAGLIPGLKGGIVPTPLLAELIAHGAKVRFLNTPDAAPEDRYRPSVALQEFIRTRDLTCRHPGCDRPAIFADIDHSVAHPAGATHPANLNCKCRKHHLLKTFWPGWSERQLPDGTLHITTPTGHTYTTKPLSTLLFPAWNVNTPPPGPTAPPGSTAAPATAGRQIMMPTRKQTRAKARQYRINAERELNATNPTLTERAKPPPF